MTKPRVRWPRGSVPSHRLRGAAIRFYTPRELRERRCVNCRGSCLRLTGLGQLRTRRA